MIKNILFDLGHVVIDIDFERSIQAFKNLGQKEFHLSLDPTLPVFEEFEVGRITSEEFIQYWRSQISGASSKDIIEAWNAILIGIAPEILLLLYKLRKRYDLFVYSNTNELHIEWVKNYLKMEYAMDDWEPSLFKKAYYSHNLGIRKPNKKGFQAILKNENIKPEETLFIDDHLLNIQAALALGIQCVHKSKDTPLADVLQKNHIN